MSNLLLIDSRVKDLEILISCLTKHTEYIVFEYDTDSLDNLLSQLGEKSYSNIGLVQHNITYIDKENSYYVSGIDTDIPVEYDTSSNTYFDVNGEIYDFSQIITHIRETKKWKMLQSMDECIVNVGDGDYGSWKQFADFLRVLATDQKTAHFDLLACNLWEDGDWVDAIGYLSQNALHVRASSNNTGWDGDFVLESDSFSMIGVYFAEKILKYSYSLANEYTLTQLTSGTRPICNENPIAASNNGVLASVRWGADIYYSTNDGATWLTATNGGNGWWAATSANGAYILATGNFASVYLNNNAGLPTNSTRAFSSVSTNGNGYTCCIDDTGKYMVYTSNAGVVYYSSNFGSSWSLIRTGSGSVTTLITRDSKKLISSTWDTSLFYLYDLSGANYGTGGSWTSYSISPSTSRRFCASGDGSILYISTSNNIIKVVNVFGTPTRTNITVSGTPYMLVCSANGKIVAYTLNTTAIYVSLDEGATFSVYTASAVVRSLGINSVGSRIYGCNGTGTIFTKLTFNAASEITVSNGYFTSPALISNSFTYYTNNLSDINGWNIVNTANNVGIANTSSTLGYPTLPAEITQWFFSHFTDKGTTTLTQNIAFANKGTYRLSHYSAYSTSTEISNAFTITSQVNDVSSGLVLLSNAAWTNTVFDFSIPNSGTYPLSFVLSLNLPDPIVHYPFDTNFTNIGTSTGTVATAVSTASISNTEYRIGTGSLSLVASKNEGLNIGSFALPSVGFSISCWFKTTDTTNYARVFNFGTNTGSNENWIQLTMNNANNNLTFQIINYFTTAVTFTLGATTTYANNTWYHVAFTAQRGSPNSTYKAYVNGVNTNTTTSATAPPATNYTVNYLGCLNGTSSFTTVNIDDFRVYGRVLMAGEITKLYNSTNLNMSMYLSGITLSYINDNTNVTGIPSAPAIVSLTPSSQQLTVNFTPATMGSSPSTYKYSINGGSLINASTQTSPFLITGLTNGSSYTIVLYASNSFGDSPASNSSTSLVGSVPDAPTLSSLTSGDKQLTVNFAAPANTGGMAILYYMYSLNGAGDISMNTMISPFIITGLTNGTAYTVKIRAVSIIGASSYSTTLSATPRGAPSAPILTGVSSVSQQMTVNFTVPSNDGGAAIQYYMYSLNGGADVSANITASPLVITGLINGTEYSVKLKAVNIAGVSDYSNILSIRLTIVPTTPVISAAIPEPKSLVVSFSADTYGYPLSKIQYSVNGAGYVDASNVFSPFVIPNLTEGQSYSVTVKIANSAGTTSPSSSFSAYLPYTYQTFTPTAMDMCGNVFRMTLSDASGNKTYKYSVNGTYWSSYINPILDMNVQGGVAWRGENYLDANSPKISFTIRGTNMNTNTITTTLNTLYNANSAGNVQRNTLTIPINIAALSGVVLLPHNNQT